MIKGFGKKIIVIGLSLIISVLNVEASCKLTGIASTTNGFVQGSSNCDLMMYCVGYTKQQVWDTNQCQVYKLTAPALAQIQAMGGGSTSNDVLGAKLAAFRGWSEGTILNNGASVNRNKLNSLGKQYYDEAIKYDKKYTIQPINGSSFIYRLISSESSNGSYTANIEVTTTANVSGQLKLGISAGHNIVNSNCNGNKCTAVISGPMEECEGANPTIYVYYSGSEDGFNIPGTPGNSESSDFYFFDCNGKQNYIGYTTDNDTKNELTPGQDGGSIPGDEKKFKDQGTIFIPDKECDCGADYSGDFVCDGSGSTSEYLKETNNILSCVTSGKYMNYCGSSIEKTVDKGKSITTIANNTTSNIVLGNSNNYCSVYCVEDINYDLPGEIKVKNGSYFTLNNSTGNKSVTISGTRRCYTDKIETSDYVADVKELQEKTLTYYNKYLKYKKLYDEMATKPDKTSETICTPQSCSAIYNKKTKKTSYSISNGTSVSRDVYTESIDYPVKECTYDSETGSASCSTSTSSETVTVKQDYSGSSGSDSRCGATPTTCGNVTGNVDDKWEDKREEFKGKYEEALETAKGYQDTMKSLIAEYKSCTNWTNNYCFNPKVEFSYEDGNLYTEVNNKELLGSEPTDGTPAVSKYANVSSDYSELKASTGVEETVKYIFVQGEGQYLAEANIDFETKYVKSIVEESKTFSESSVKVCTYHPYGTIKTGAECTGGGNYTLLNGNGYVFPVTLEKKETRKYNYDLIFSNIGVAGDDASCANAQTNRLMGCDNPTDVYTVETSKSEPKYTCQYSSCPECETECVCPEDRPDCYVEDKICKYVECDDCVVSCIGCLWNNGNSTFAYKTISLSDVFPNSENDKVGYNWNTSNINPESEKASATIQEIENAGEKAYLTPEYSYKLSPTTMAKIRAYNEEANKENVSSKKWGNNSDIPNGGYNNNTLVCKNGSECKSTFLNGLDDIVGERNRIRNDKWTTKNGSAWK